jgi:hypothetical protein
MINAIGGVVVGWGVGGIEAGSEACWDEAGLFPDAGCGRKPNRQIAPKAAHRSNLVLVITEMLRGQGGGVEIVGIFLAEGTEVQHRALGPPPL